MDLDEPYTELRNLEVRPIRLTNGEVRVELLDPRCGLSVLLLTPAEAAYLGGRLVVASGRARLAGKQGS